jgi:hypothetical protein
MTDTRAQFEAHFQLSSRQAKKDNAGCYIDEKVRDKWEGWQAAMAAVEKDASQRDSALCIGEIVRPTHAVNTITVAMENEPSPALCTVGTRSCFASHHLGNKMLRLFAVVALGFGSRWLAGEMPDAAWMLGWWGCLISATIWRYTNDA